MLGDCFRISFVTQPLSSFSGENVKKKMNSQPQNGVILAKFILLLQFLISLNDTPWLTLNFQFCPC